MRSRTDRQFRELTMKVESDVSNAITDAFDLGYDDGRDAAEGEWVAVASKFGCASPSDLEEWYQNMLTRMAEVINEQSELQ